MTPAEVSRDKPPGVGGIFISWGSGLDPLDEMGLTVSSGCDQRGTSSDDRKMGERREGGFVKESNTNKLVPPVSNANGIKKKKTLLTRRERECQVGRIRTSDPRR
jgi:hypothetical protein